MEVRCHGGCDLGDISIRQAAVANEGIGLPGPSCFHEAAQMIQKASAELAWSTAGQAIQDAKRSDASRPERPVIGDREARGVLPAMRLWKAGANGVLEKTKRTLQHITMGPSATHLREWRNIDVASSYFCRAAHF